MTALLRLLVNEVEREVGLPSGTSLLDGLRDGLGLTGTKYGCGEGVCGACTVLVDGQPVRSCVTSLGDVVGRRITTIEGLAGEGQLHPVQRAFLEEGALQCGFCTPGMVLATVALLAREPDPDDGQLAVALAGNICRCGTYPRIRRAVHRARSAPDLVPSRAHPLGPGRGSCPRILRSALGWLGSGTAPRAGPGRPLGTAMGQWRSLGACR